jgi:hypothetical protein
MKMIIAEDHPSIIPFDQDLFARKLFYDDQSAADAVALFDLNRRMLGTVLKKLPESAFARTGKHVERGEITLAQCVQFMTEHLEHHLKFIHAKREAMGKEMW